MNSLHNQVSLQVSEHTKYMWLWFDLIWLVTLQLYVIFAELKFMSVRLVVYLVYFVKYFLLEERLPISNRHRITCTKKRTKYLYSRQDQFFFWLRKVFIIADSIDVSMRLGKNSIAFHHGSFSLVVTMIVKKRGI